MLGKSQERIREMEKEVGGTASRTTWHTDGTDDGRRSAVPCWFEVTGHNHLTYFTLDELFRHRRRVGIQSDVSILHPVVHQVDPHLLAPFRNIVFPSMSWPSPRSFSSWVDHECSTLGSCWCHPLDMWPPPDLILVCSAGCMFTRRLISSFLILSILVFPAAFLRHLISVVVNICLSLLVSVQFSSSSYKWCRWTRYHPGPSWNGGRIQNVACSIHAYPWWRVRSNLCYNSVIETRRKLDIRITYSKQYQVKLY